MRHLRGALAAIGAACLAATVGGVAAVGCGGDTVSGALDGGWDALEEGESDAVAEGSADGPSADGTLDASMDVSVDSAQDSAVPQDSSMPVDSSNNDSSPPQDATPPKDATGSEGGDASVGPEAGLDASRDAADGSDGSDGSNPIAIFATNLATAICNHFQPCCPALDAGQSYNLPQCIDSYQGYGWEGNLPNDQTVLSRGNLTFDQTKANGCVAAVNNTNIPCGGQTAAGWSAVTTACIGVVQGTIAIGHTGCISSFECAPGAYCDTSVGGGTCTALHTQGQPCNTVINSIVEPIPDEMCSYLGSSSNGLYCDLIDDPDASTYATCQPLLTAGATCENSAATYFDDQACPAAGALCGDNIQCGGTASYPYSGSGPCAYTQ